MKLLFATIAILGLPLLGWGQARLTKAPVHPAATKTAETLQARYARLDQLARQLPEAQATSLAKLAAALATQARTDDDKARLIFTWIAHHIAYDVAFLKGDTTHSYAPEQVLQSRVAICQGYADLFTALATRMKLPAGTVEGYANSNYILPSSLSSGSNANHAWNLYDAGGKMHIADACWGAGSVSSDGREFTRQFNPFWYDTPPEQAIFLHLPSSDTYQLLATPVTPATFRRWPYIESTWFRLGVSGASMSRALENTKGKIPALPYVYDSASGVQIVQVPRQAELVAGQPVKFAFSVPANVELALELNDEVLPLQVIGSHHQLNITPALGSIGIIIWQRTTPEKQHYLLRYKVIPAPKKRLQPGQHRTMVLDSIAYLRH